LNAQVLDFYRNFYLPRAKFFPIVADQTFLETASDAIGFLHRLRAAAFAEVENYFDEEEYLHTQASALVLLASEDLIKEFGVQIDKHLDGLPVDKTKLLLLLECCDRTCGLLSRIDIYACDEEETEEENFYRGTEMRIQLLENLSMVPDWPDSDVLQEKARIGGRVLEELRADTNFDEDAFEEFREYVLHIGTMLVRMAFADADKTCP
jgi:hypothetical protein